MPELPEVETVVRYLKEVLPGNQLKGVHVIDLKHDKAGLESLVGGRVSRVFRSGKEVGIELRQADKRQFLLVHLRMTGRLLWSEQGEVGDTSYQRVLFQFQKSLLQFKDVRRFGTLRVYEREEDFSKAGVDPTSDSLTSDLLLSWLKKSKQPVKTWLLRQDRILGLGNIYACEILAQAKIHPQRVGSSLSREEVHSLFRHTKAVIQAAIENCGTTFSDFQQSNGEIGSYQNYLLVYGRAGEKCKRCKKNNIEKIVQAGRSTFFCAYCQR